MAPASGPLRSRPGRRAAAGSGTLIFSFDSRGGAMSTPRILLSAFVACAVFLSTAYSNSGTERDVIGGAGRREGGESHHRRGAAESGTEGDPQLGSASRGPEVGHVGRCRHRSERRTRLGLRALRRRHAWRGRGRRGHCETQPRRSHLQVRPPYRRGAGKLRQGRDGDAAWHPRGPTGQCVDCRLRGQRGGHEGATRSTSSARRARSF